MCFARVISGTGTWCVQWHHTLQNVNRCLDRQIETAFVQVAWFLLHAAGGVLPYVCAHGIMVSFCFNDVELFGSSLIYTDILQVTRLYVYLLDIHLELRTRRQRTVCDVMCGCTQAQRRR